MNKVLMEWFTTGIIKWWWCERSHGFDRFGEKKIPYWFWIVICVHLAQASSECRKHRNLTELSPSPMLHTLIQWDFFLFPRQHTIIDNYISQFLPIHTPAWHGKGSNPSGCRVLLVFCRKWRNSSFGGNLFICQMYKSMGIFPFRAFCFSDPHLRFRSPV